MTIARGVILSVACVALLGACSGEKEPDNRAQLTQREKDSILGASKIPGAKAVNRAMTSADSATARQARLDSAQNNP